MANGTVAVLPASLAGSEPTCAAGEAAFGMLPSGGGSVWLETSVEDGLSFPPAAAAAWMELQADVVRCRIRCK
ncbi:MAG: hypothetical protein ACRER5_18745 [Pseudomonas sp.]